MPRVLNEHIDRLIEAEDYYWKRGTWEKDKEEERALWCIWSVVEDLLQEREKERKKMKRQMRKYRAKDKDYGRRYRKSEDAMQHEREYRRKYYLTVVKPKREAQKEAKKGKL